MSFRLCWDKRRIILQKSALIMFLKHCEVDSIKIWIKTGHIIPFVKLLTKNLHFMCYVYFEKSLCMAKNHNDIKRNILNSSWVAVDFKFKNASVQNQIILFLFNLNPFIKLEKKWTISLHFRRGSSLQSFWSKC